MSVTRIPRNAFRVRIKSIDETVRIVGARTIASGKVFDVVGDDCRARTFLAQPHLYDASPVELLAEWERLSVKRKKTTKAKLEPWEKALTESRKLRDAEDDFDAPGIPSEIPTIAARGRADEIEPEPSEDAEPPEADTEAVSETDTIEFVPLPETEYEEFELD